MYDDASNSKLIKPRNFDRAMQKRFLKAYAKRGSVTHAAKAAKVARRSHANWMKGDPDYRVRFQQARKAAADALELEARRRAVDGVTKPIVQAGKVVCGWVNAAGDLVAEDDPNAVKKIPILEHAYSDKLLADLLRANKPSKFRERKEVTHKGGQAIKFETREQKLARVTSRIAELRAAGLLGSAIRSDNDNS